MNHSRTYEGTNFVTGLRAIAVFLVFLIHSGGGGLRDFGPIASRLVDFGKFGVPVFFVISGFTIFYQLFEEKYSFKRFVFIRVIRISLPYFPVLLGLYLYLLLGGEQINHWAIILNNGIVTIENLVYHFLYIASFDLRYANTIIGVEWSLHIEVFFYLVIGYLVSRRFLTSRWLSVGSWITIFLALFLVFSYLGFIALIENNRSEFQFLNWLPFRYGWMFLLGGIAYFIRMYMASILTVRLASIFSNFALILVCFFSFSLLLFSVSNNIDIINEIIFSFLVFVLLVFLRDDASLSSLLTNRLIVFMGAISFSFYLLHYVVIGLDFSSYFGFEDLFYVFLFDFVTAVVVSFLWYMVFEKNLYAKFKSIVNNKYAQ